MEPQYLYKYRELQLNGSTDLASNYDIDALLKCEAILNSRKRFTDKDEHDAEINLITKLKPKCQLPLN